MSRLDLEGDTEFFSNGEGLLSLDWLFAEEKDREVPLEEFRERISLCE